MNVVVSGRGCVCLKRHRERVRLPRQKAQGIDRTGGGKTHSNGLSSAEKQGEIEREK